MVNSLLERLKTLSPEKQKLVLQKLEQQRRIAEAEQELPIVRVPRDKPISLSFAQQRLWFLTQLEPENTSYHIANALKLSGPLNLSALHKSLETLIYRHEALRTTFVATEGIPEQIIAEHWSLDIPLIDLRAYPKIDRDAEVQRLLRTAIQKPFDLSSDLMLRTLLLQLDEEEHVVLFVWHHIAFDGWSLGIFSREFSILYSAFCAGQLSPLTELPIQYADFAAWQRKRLHGEELETHVQYWKKQLQGAPDSLELPTDYPRPSVQTHRGAHQLLVLPAPLTDALKTLSRQQRVTLPATLLAAFEIFLYHCTGQQDILLGVPFAGRNRTEVEQLIGYFLNNLPVRINLSDNPTFAELLERVQKVLLETHAHQHIPIENLQKDLNLGRDLSQMRLFQVVFNFLNLPPSELTLPNLMLSRVKMESGSSTFDLTLYIEEEANTLQGIFEYNTDLFKATTITEMMTRFQRLLEVIVANPHWRIAELPLLKIAESTEASYPLSSLQQGILFHSLQSEQTGGYIEQMVIRLHEDLNVPVFVQSWQCMLTRHPILRTGFEWKRVAHPLQFVSRHVDFLIEQHDWRELSPRDQEEQFQLYLQADRTRGIDLSLPPLMRVALFRLADHDYNCLWTFHHILLDGRSFTILLKEVFSCYDALCQGLEWSAPSPRPYRDFIEWLQQQSFEANKPFWQELLNGFTVPTPLPFSRSEHIGQGYSEQQMHISATVTSTLHTLAERHQLTLNTLIQGAWAMLLSQYSGESDIVFGATRAGRHAPIAGAESMLGVFINTLPVRVQCSSEEPLLKMLQTIRAQSLALRQYEHTPLSKIQEWSDIPPGSPLFESILVFENYRLNTILQTQGGKWQQREFHLFEQTPYPLTIAGYADSELLLTIEYDLARFDHDTISRILTHLKRLLEGMAASGLERSLLDVPLLAAAERQQIVVEWNETQQHISQDVCVQQLFEAQVEHTPEAVALSSGDTCLTYQELNQRANQLAHYLRHHGVGPETIVGLCVERSPEMIIGLLGILKAGGAYVPLDPDYPTDRLAFILDDTQASMLLTQNHLLHSLPAYEGQMLCLDTEWPAIAHEGIQNPAHEAITTNLAYLIYTSGSTGSPKGVMIEHGALVNFVETIRETYAITSHDRVLQFASISFDASAEEIYPCLTCGATLVLRNDEMLSSPDIFWQWCGDMAITVLDLPTAYWHQLVATAELDVPDSLRLLIIGGEQAQANNVAQWLSQAPQGVRLINTYGPTEATVVATTYEVSANTPSDIVPIGRPIGNVHTYILNQSLRPVPIGAPGELCLGGAGLARGYLNRPELTVEHFIPNPFGEHSGTRLYKTGDLARYLPDGSIEFLGRRDYQVKLRGFRIELGEIEAVLRQHPSVQDAIAIVRKDHPGERRLVGYVTTGQTPPPTINELRQVLQRTLPNYMVPSAFVVLDALPLMPNGKVDRKALPVPDQTRPELEEDFVSPSNPIESLIAEIWQELLGIEKVSIYDNFFDLGGHSLLVMQVIARIEKELGIRLSPGDFILQTLGQIAVVCEEKQRLPRPAQPETVPQKLWRMVKNTVSRKV